MEGAWPAYTHLYSIQNPNKNSYVIKAHDDTNDHQHTHQQHHRTLLDSPEPQQQEGDKGQKKGKTSKGGDNEMVVVENAVLALAFANDTGRLVRDVVCSGWWTDGLLVWD